MSEPCRFDVGRPSTFFFSREIGALAPRRCYDLWKLLGRWNLLEERPQPSSFSMLQVTHRKLRSQLERLRVIHARGPRLWEPRIDPR